MSLSDEDRITLYLDGAMTAAEAEALEREVGERPELAEMLERWQRNDARLRAAFDLPVPEDMAARLGLEPAAPAKVVDLGEARARRERRRISPGWGWGLGGALAASLVAAVSLGLVGGGAGDPFATEQFQVAMQTLPSRQVAHLSGGETLTLTLSFADGSGRFCREFALAGEESRVGVACRRGGRWAVEGVAAGSGPAADPGEMRTAGGDGAALDPVYRRLDAGDPFDPERERQLIASGWSAPPAVRE
ncbi:MAG TPA: hypothetical protein VF704_08080 [Allosphingosinicella sp.]|jgi:hypothetical protein